jgi:uncharacterized membrane protein
MKPKEIIILFLLSIFLSILIVFTIDKSNKKYNTPTITIQPVEYIILENNDTAWAVYTTRTYKTYTLTKPN